ncbi:MAG: WYL domain-containing protein, partial [Propionibacteriales bacterium]|nr:WYL domain-containing protein [Propionibacteriales bacterium]
QIIKDLNVVWFCGLPDAMPGDMIDIDMDALDGEGVVRLSNADFLTRPLRLVPHEALALVVALRALREAGGDRERQAVDRALTKLESAAGEAAEAAAAVDIRVDPVDQAIRTAVDTALHENRRMHLRYYVPSRDETTERDVDPLRLVFSAGQVYLEAWCTGVREVRFFRLDRMTAAEVSQEAASPPSGAGRTDLSKGVFKPSTDNPLAVVELDPSARWMADYYPIEDSDELPDARLRITLRVRDTEWLVRLILRVGGGATVVEPADIAEAVRERARQALANYSSV